METTTNAVESRRSFLKRGAVLAGGAAGTLAAPAIVRAQAPRVIRMTSSWSPVEPFQVATRRYAELIAAMSGGRLTVDLTSAGAIVGAFQVMDAVSDGLVDAVSQVPVYWYAKNRGASLFGTGPVMGADSVNLIGWMQAGGGAELYRELTQDVLGLNVTSFFSYPMPAQPFGWFKTPVTSVADVNGLKYRTVGLAADLMQAMGMSVVQLPGGEIVPAMERGVIDAFEYNNPTADRLFGAPDVAKNYMLASYHQATEFMCFDWNKTFFDSLEDDLKAIIEGAANAVVPYAIGLALDNYSKDLAAMEAEQGVKVFRTPQDVLTAQLAAWDSLIPSFEADPVLNKILSSQRAWIDRTVRYQLYNSPDYRLAYDHYFPGKVTF